MSIEFKKYSDCDCAGFLPISLEEMNELGWDRPDFVFVSGDAYIDHPSFGTAIIARVLAKKGFKVAILPQPDWKTLDDFKKFGRPRLGFLVSSGVIDSMVNHYTVAKKRRRSDVYTPGGEGDQRPDRAVIVYCNKIRESYKKVPIILGGIEASLRRFVHYDYWSDKVRRSILDDSGADILVYGMGEKPIVEIAELMDAGVRIEDIKYVRGSAFATSSDENIEDWIDENGQTFENVILPSFEEVSSDKKKYAEAYMLQQEQIDTIYSPRLIQVCGKNKVCVNPPSISNDRRELDYIYSLPYKRTEHPLYAKKIPALQEVEFSVTSARGCFGSCSFCALTYHQGRTVNSRSQESIHHEVENMTHSPNFKGYVHDVGGPTANFRESACARQAKGNSCPNKRCLHPKPCANLKVNHDEYTDLLQRLRTIPGIKKVFIRSGIRYDYLLYDKKSRRDRFMRELVEHHVSGQLKIAPEHVNESVLALMGKPGPKLYEEFRELYIKLSKEYNLDQYIVPYFISSHPGSDLNAAIELALYMKKNQIRAEQVQDFYPTPGTLSTTMYYTGIDPRNGEKVYVASEYKDKQMQRALLQYYKRENYFLVKRALEQANREDLIGFDKNCLIRPQTNAAFNPKNETRTQNTRSSPERKNRSENKKNKTASKNIKSKTDNNKTRSENPKTKSNIKTGTDNLKNKISNTSSKSKYKTKKRVRQQKKK